MSPEQHAQEAAPQEPREIRCENCETPIPDDRLDCHCDEEGLWFCAECWQALLDEEPGDRN